MRVLMIAPQPFFQERGTPISIRQRLEVLSRWGYRIDLLTYPLGQEVHLPGVRILRLRRIPFIRQVPIGPSLRKLFLDILLFFRAWRLLRERDYDCLHTHEEGALLGGILRRVFHLPHVYDMHSSLSEQLVNYGVIPPGPLLSLARWGERWLLRQADVVIAISPHLGRMAQQANPQAQVVVIPNRPPLTPGCGSAPRALFPSSPVVLYAGNFSRNQGLELLLQAMVHVRREGEDARLLLVGGEPRQIERLKRLARQLQVGSRVTFLGHRPLTEVARLLEQATVLVSPRCRGTNPPLKIYSYLLAGRPIVATRIPAHTQVLNEEVAVLTEVQPTALAQGIVRLLRDEPLREQLGRKARALALANYNEAGFEACTRAAYQAVKRLGERRSR
ncbi:MAG TPA: glycosyltransferase family 1 protein [Armatimonadetes bacterium]|nr:glycosyltransferase family 1 protein [Armatimonadota bacterium]